MFGIDWAILLGLGGFVGTLILGAPFTRALAEPEGWRSSGRKASPPPRDKSVVGIGFTPLDLGEDPMQWPSERPWPKGLESPPWPSQTWDDEHFGSFWRGNNAPPLQDEPEAEASPRRSSPPTRARKTPRRGVARTPKGPTRSSIGSAGGGLAAKSGQAPSPSPRSPETPSSQLPSVSPPPAEELERLIATVGLAGTVQQIIQRTGWDFRRAAHYLAHTRQKD